MFSISHIEACIKGLESARINGLFAATTYQSNNISKEVTFGDSQENDDNYSLAWVRDTLKCSYYDLIAENREHLQDTISTLLTYFRNNIHIIERTIEDNKNNRPLSFDSHAILPRMIPETLEPVHADQKKDLQLDMAEFLKHLSLIIQKDICVLKNRDDILLVLKLIDYFIAWNYSRNASPPGDFGIWEEGKEGTKGSLIPVIHSSSIAAILSGFMHINGLTLKAEDGSTQIVSIPENIIHSGVKFLNERISLVGECEERPYDLTSLMILYDHLILKEMGKGDLLTQENQTKILNNFSRLERDYGFMRYASDEHPDDLDNYHKDEYDELDLVCLDTADSLPQQGRGLVVIAKINNFYQVRIFDKNKRMLLDQGKDKFLPNQQLVKYLEVAFQSQSVDETTKNLLIEEVFLSLGYEPPPKKSAEWTMGFGYAALIYEKLGQLGQALEYVSKMEKAFDWERKLGLPEAYFGQTKTPVPISPLSWSNALYLIIYEIFRINANIHRTMAIS